MSGSSHSVLVVDDQEAIRTLIGHMLERRGIGTFQAGTAEEGLRLMGEHKSDIHLAIIDMMMPGVTGLDLAAELSREHPQLKILYISGYVESLAVDVIARRSPKAVLLKPFTEQTLVDRVNFLLDEAPDTPANGPNQAA